MTTVALFGGSFNPPHIAHQMVALWVLETQAVDGLWMLPTWRHPFGKPLVDHEGVGFMLAENLIDLKQAELMIDWCASVLDTGSLGTVESSMAKVAVSEALMRIADRCVQVMGGTGVTDRTIVEQVFREIRAFRIYDGPTEVHKWSLAKKIRRDWKQAQG